jgi:hypothetical protein
MTDQETPHHQVSMQMLITVQDGDEVHQFTVQHEVTRYPSGKWRIRSTRNGTPSEFWGDGQVPTMIDAGDTVIIFVTAGTTVSSSQSSPPTST